MQCADLGFGIFLASGSTVRTAQCMCYLFFLLPSKIKSGSVCGLMRARHWLERRSGPVFKVWLGITFAASLECAQFIRVGRNHVAVGFLQR